MTQYEKVQPSGRVMLEQPLTTPGCVRQIVAHHDRVELAVLRNGTPAGGTFLLAEHLPIVVLASHEAARPGRGETVVGRIPVRTGRLEVSAHRRPNGDGAVVFQIRGDAGEVSRPTRIRGGELAALDRACDLILGAP